MARLFAGTEFDIPPTCDACGKLEDDCKCPPVAAVPKFAPPNKLTAKVRVDRRKHKRLMTVVWGLAPDSTDLNDLLSKLKNGCGTGGSLQEDQIELQGDHLDRAKKLLAEIGFKVR
jgi:translation initiation factor 1